MKNKSSLRNISETLAVVLFSIGIVLLAYVIVLVFSDDRHINWPLEFLVSPS